MYTRYAVDVQIRHVLPKGGLRRRQYGTFVKNTRYAVVSLEGDTASGRAEPDILFGKTWLSEPRFSKKIEERTLLPQANLAPGSGTRPK